MFIDFNFALAHPLLEASLSEETRVIAPTNITDTMNPNTRILFPARLTRVSFFFRGLLLLFGGLIAAGLFSSMEHSSLVAQIVLLAVAVPLVIFLFVALFWSILIPRLRDIGLRPAWSLLILVHALDGLFLLALLCIPANAFAGRPYANYR